MAITTYSELKTAVANWINRTDLTSRIPEFIALAETRINRRLRIRAMETVYNADTASSTKLYALPTGFAGMRSFKLNTDPLTDLDYMTPENMDRIWAGSSTGKPKAYTLEGDNLRLSPTPDGAYEMELLYYKKFDALSDAAPTNWLMLNAPDVLLYGACLEAAPYMKGHPDIPVWGEFFKSAMDDIETEDEQDRHSGGAMAVRPDSPVY